MGSVANAEHAGEPSRTIGENLRAWPPPAVAATTSVAGSILLAVVMVAIGLVITRSFLSPRIVGWDGSVERWVEVRRTATLNTWSDVGSILAGAGTILLVAGIAIGVLLIRRLWYDAAFLGIGLFIEFTAFLATEALIDRPHPAIVRLNSLPATSSFPSGHTGAASVVYIGLALLISSHVRRPAVRIPTWIVAPLLPIYVGVSRVYRGMHHPTDVMASVVLGVGALCFALKVRVDGRRWFSGKASTVLLGNVGTVLGGLTLFPRARPDDGRLEIGVVTAKGLLDWGRTLGRSVISDPERSPFVHVTSGRAFEIRLDRKRPYELDGGDRKPTKRFRVSVEPAAVAVCVASETS